MNKLRTLVFLMVLALLVASFSSGPAAAQENASRNYRAHLNAENEVPSVDSLAQGQAIFKLSEDGTTIHYKLIVTNIDNVRMAHIHRGPAGVNGPVVVWLYPDSPPPQLIPGRFDGVLAQGSFTAADFVGPLAGMSMEDLIALFESGEAYVNVHTIEFGGGEVRGQIH